MSDAYFRVTPSFYAPPDGVLRVSLKQTIGRDDLIPDDYISHSLFKIWGRSTCGTTFKMEHLAKAPATLLTDKGLEVLTKDNGRNSIRIGDVYTVQGNESLVGKSREVRFQMITEKDAQRLMPKPVDTTHEDALADTQVIAFPEDSNQQDDSPRNEWQNDWPWADNQDEEAQFSGDGGFPENCMADEEEEEELPLPNNSRKSRLLSSSSSSEEEKAPLRKRVRPAEESDEEDTKQEKKSKVAALKEKVRAMQREVRLLRQKKEVPKPKQFRVPRPIRISKAEKQQALKAEKRILAKHNVKMVNIEALEREPPSEESDPTSSLEKYTTPHPDDNIIQKESFLETEIRSAVLGHAMHLGKASSLAIIHGPGARPKPQNTYLERYLEDAMEDAKTSVDEGNDIETQLIEQERLLYDQNRETDRRFEQDPTADFYTVPRGKVQSSYEAGAEDRARALSALGEARDARDGRNAPEAPEAEPEGPPRRRSYQRRSNLKDKVVVFDSDLH